MNDDAVTLHPHRPRTATSPLNLQFTTPPTQTRCIVGMGFGTYKHIIVHSQGNIQISWTVRVGLSQEGH
jgi:hypothetical protein